MKKIVSIFLLLAITTLFVSCGDNDSNSDDPMLNTFVGGNLESTTAAPTENQGYVLTTNPEQTVYCGNTTLFYPTTPDQATSTTVVVPVVSDQNTTSPTPSMSQVSTTQTTQSTTNNSQTSPTVVDAPDNTTAVSGDEQGGNENTDNTAQPVYVSSASASKMSNGDITIDISSSGWDSVILSNSGTATVTYGSNTQSCACSVSSTMEGGNYVITVFTSELDIYSGAQVTVTIPEGLIKSASGTQYNSSFTSKRITF